MAQLKVIKEFPALKVLEAPNQLVKSPDSEITYSEVKAIFTDVQMYVNDTLYSADSVMSYAIENNKCPLAAYEKAIENKHKVYWINQAPVALSNMKREQKSAYAYEVGDIVVFQGKLFTIETAANDNLKLTAI